MELKREKYQNLVVSAPLCTSGGGGGDKDTWPKYATRNKPITRVEWDDTCIAYCITWLSIFVCVCVDNIVYFFLHFRANGHSMADFQRLFSTNTLTNDALLKQKFDLCFKRWNVGKHENTRDTQSCCCRKNR